MSGNDHKKRLVIIDGKSVFYRGYYAMPNLSTKDGKPTGGVFGFATMALEVIKRLKPDYVAVAWDKPKTNIRKRLAMYPEYKAGRKPAPADFYEQVPILIELLDALGWPLYELDDYEADDIMGTLATQASQKGIETLLVTSDMDMLQLVNDKVHVYALKTGLSNIELYSPKSFEAKYGINVDQFLDLKALKGDSSDNIPGVPGIGEKGALELLKSYQSLDNIYDNIELIKDSLRKKLLAGKELAYLSRELARIWTDAPLKLNIAEVDGSKIQPEKVLEILNQLEFRTLARHLPEIVQVKLTASDKQNQGFSLTAKPQFINSPSEVSRISLKDDKVYCYIHFAGEQGTKPTTLIIGDQATTYAVNLTSFSDDQISDLIKEHLPPKKKLIGYDLKSFIKIFLNYGQLIPKIEHDIQIASFLIDPLNRDQSLEALAFSQAGYEGSGLKESYPENILEYAGDIIEVLKRLYDFQTKEFEQLNKLKKLSLDIEWPIIPVLAHMEWIGIELDKNYLEKFKDEIDDLVLEYEQKIYGYADEEFNIGSPSQLANILFNKLKLSTTNIKKGKNGYSTAASELLKLRGQHPIIDQISLYREVAKLKNTYVDTLPKMVDKNSRLHTSFNLTIAQTGRLSSTDPNLQNIPTRTDLGKRIRQAFIAGKGNKLVSADYSQFELRLAAVLAGDDELIKMFNEGADIHAATAADIYGRSQEDVSKQMRRAAKVINFGILYGMSPHGLSIATGIAGNRPLNL